MVKNNNLRTATPKMHYVRRGSQIQGPVSETVLADLISKKRILVTDEIADCATGPWKPYAKHPAVKNIRQNLNLGCHDSRFFSALSTAFKNLFFKLFALLSFTMSLLYVAVIITGSLLIAFVVLGFVLNAFVSPEHLRKYEKLVELYAFFNMDTHILGLDRK